MRLQTFLVFGPRKCDTSEVDVMTLRISQRHGSRKLAPKMDGWKGQSDQIQPLTKFTIQKSRVSAHRGATFGPGHSDIPREKTRISW